MPQKPRARTKRKAKPSPTPTVRKRRLPISAESFAALADGLGVGLALCDSEGNVRFCNATFNDVLDGSLGGNLNILERLKSDSQAEFAQALNEAKWLPVEGKLELMTGDGILRTFRVSLSPFGRPRPDGDIWVLAHELTELLETGRALDDSKGNVSFLSGRLIQAQDAERRRMARDLHDITGQELAVILMSLNRLSNNLATPGFDAKTDLSETVSLVRKVENEIRTLSYVLHPPMLDELGLKSALGWFVEGFTKRSKIRIQMDIPESLPRLSRDKEIAIFRIVQESLTNVLRHSHSETARIRAEIRHGYFLLFVQDAGQGLPSSVLRSGRLDKVVPGVGILGMRERLQQLGGTLVVDSSSAGTQVRASVPLGGDTEEPVVSELAGEPEPAPPEPASVPAGTARILIADDHELMRVGIRTLLAHEPNLEVCGEAADGVEAVLKALNLKPDLVILDLMMPRLGGFSAAKQILQMRPTTKILAFTNYAYSQVAPMLRAIGCQGYVSKSRASTDLIVAIRAVLAGRTFLEPEAAQTNSDELQTKSEAAQTKSA